MYYVFYDTGNDVFFSYIAEAFCEAAMKYVDNHTAQFKQTNNVAIYKEQLKIFLENENKQALAPMNCGLLSNCGKQDCRKNYRAVFTSDQIECFSQLMKDGINAFYKDTDYLRTSKDRANLQEAFQNVIAVSDCDIIEIPISSKKNTIEFKKSNPCKYKRMYVAEAKKLIKKKVNTAADTFVYIRAQTKSHFKFFSRKIKPPKLKPCDYFS
jgi:hypothetical protein